MVLSFGVNSALLFHTESDFSSGKTYRQKKNGQVLSVKYWPRHSDRPCKNRSYKPIFDISLKARFYIKRLNFEIQVEKPEREKLRHRIRGARGPSEMAHLALVWLLEVA